MKGTKISWADDTCNPVAGCGGCELWKKGGPTERNVCYAAQLTERYGGTSSGYPVTFDQVTLFPGRMAKAARAKALTGTTRGNKPWLDGRPRFVFVSDMGDALSSGVPFAYLAQEIVDVVQTLNGRRHTWLWLTKRARRMAEFSAWLGKRGIAWPANLWAGTTITTQGSCQRIEDLLKVGTGQATLFLSVEPQLGPVTLAKWLPQIDWVIQGGASGANAKDFDLAWARSLRDECKAAGTSYFLKQLGRMPVENGSPYPLKLDRSHGGDFGDWPADLRIRQVP